MDKKLASTTGILFVNVWIVNDVYPIAYHMEIIAGTFEKIDVYTSAFLGVGSKANVHDTVKSNIGSLVDKLAIAFFKARGEL